MTDTPKRPRGQPTKYDPSYCERIIEHMKDGASALSFAAEVGVSRATLNVWADAHPDFLEALSAGKAACGAWWEKQGRAVAESGGGNGQSAMIAFGLKNMGREEWADRTSTELTGANGGPIQTSSLDLSKLSDEELRNWQALATKAMRGGE